MEKGGKGGKGGKGEKGGKGWKSGVDRMEKGGKGGKSRWVGQVKTRGSFGWLEFMVKPWLELVGWFREYSLDMQTF